MFREGPVQNCRKPEAPPSDLPKGFNVAAEFLGGCSIALDCQTKPPGGKREVLQQDVVQQVSLAPEMVLDLSGVDAGVGADLAYADRVVAVRAEEDAASVPQPLFGLL
jgi:hypothetical protein